MKCPRWILLSTLAVLLACNQVGGQSAVRPTGPTCGFCAPSPRGPASTQQMVNDLMNIARSLYHEGRYHEAYAILKAVQGLDPKNHSARAALVLVERRIHTRPGVEPCQRIGIDSEQCEQEDPCLQPASGSPEGVDAACAVLGSCWQWFGGPCEIAVRCLTAGVKKANAAGRAETRAGCASQDVCPAESYICTVSGVAAADQCDCGKKCTCKPGTCKCAGGKCICKEGGCGTSKTATAGCSNGCPCCPLAINKQVCSCVQACRSKGKGACSETCQGHQRRPTIVFVPVNRWISVERKPSVSSSVHAAAPSRCPVLAGRVPAPEQPPVVIIIHQSQPTPQVVPTTVPVASMPITSLPVPTYIPAPLPPLPFVDVVNQAQPYVVPHPCMLPPGWHPGHGPVVPTGGGAGGANLVPAFAPRPCPPGSSEPCNIHEDRPGTILRPQD